MTFTQLDLISAVPPQELDVRRSTTVPAWWALWVLVKYRSSRNFRSGAYLGARLGESPSDICTNRPCTQLLQTLTTGCPTTKR